MLSIQIEERGREQCATIVLRPSWIRRLFGASDVVCELVWNGTVWCTRYTRERVSHIPYAGVIEQALRMQPIKAVGFPAARIKKNNEAVAT